MNRAMFSGVAGMKAHQSKMDVIGNNISNVNTYGFKSQRAVFSDIYYQTIKSASGGTANRGGTNPSTVGYGSSLSSVQTQMTQSSMQNTGFGLDVAIMGEGFLQVMDPDGNIFYTKAGLLDYDSNGYLTDINGNFVLGSAGSGGTPGSQKIKLDNIGSVNPSRASITTPINSVNYTISSSNSSAKGNVSLNIGSSDALPDGLLAKATISNTGSISVSLNKNATFASMADLNEAINKAIIEENGGKAHAAGEFTITASENVFATPLTGEEVAGGNFGKKPGSISGWQNADAFGKMSLIKTSSGFSGTGTINPADFKATYKTGAAGDSWEITMDIGGVTYTGEISEKTTAATLLLKSANDDDYIQVSNPQFEGMTKYYNTSTGTTTAPVAGNSMNAFAPNTPPMTATPATPSKDLGLGTVGAFVLSGGTEGGPITLAGLANIAIATDGTVFVTHAEKGTVVAGQISLASFGNPGGMEQAGTNYFKASANSGEPELSVPGTSGTGALKSNALEMSNVDLSAEFSDMITTQRGFQANSRVITVSDTMLEELINLKR